MIRAQCHSDDHLFFANFDAERFFVQASDQEILDLAKCEWGGDYPADAVALHFEGINSYQDVTRIFEYTRLKEDMGFECHVDKSDALGWIAKNRQEIYVQVLEACDEDPADYTAATPSP